MITNLEIRDDETALAFGQRFDVEKVLEAAIAFLKAFAGGIVAAAPHVVPTIRFNGDGDRLDMLDDDGYARLRRATIGPGNVHDVEASGVRVDVGTFRLRLYLRGRDDLRRVGRCAPTLIDDGSWTDLDPTPLIEFQPTQGMLPLFDPKPLALLKELVRLHAPAGAHLAVERCIPALRFPHHAFGAGLGTLRISLLTVPVDP